MNSKHLPAMIAVVAIFTTTPTVSGATHVYDLKNDWSDTANPNEPWSYRAGDTLLASAQPQSIVGAFASWGDLAFEAGLFRNSVFDGFYPEIEIGDVCVWTASEGLWGCAEGGACMFQTFYNNAFPYSMRDESPGPRANACWTAPMSGTVSLSGSIWPGTCGVFWILSVNGNVISQGSAPCENSITRNSPFDLTLGTGGVEALGPIAVTAGDQVVLTVGSNSLGAIPVAINFTIVLNDQSGDPVITIEALATTVYNLNLQNGIENSLDGKLDAALAALEDANVNNEGAACSSLAAFINAVEAQRGKKITDAQANELIAAAQEIRAMLNCGS